MSRKVYIELKVKVIATLEDGVEVGEFVQEINYNIRSTDDLGEVNDTEILDYEVKDSK